MEPQDCMPWNSLFGGGNQVPYDILNIKDVATYFRIPVSTVYKLAQEGKVPAVKVGRHWRFLKKDLQLLFIIKKGEEHFQIHEGKAGS